MFGADGQDTIDGGHGDDLVNGGAGTDTLHGDEVQHCVPIDCSTGQDTIEARDGANDDVKCGRGDDTAKLDPGDSVPGSGPDFCEHIDRATATGVGATRGDATDLTAPQMRNLRIGNVRRGRSTKVRYSLSEAAAVTFTVLRRSRRRGTMGWVKVRGTLGQEGKAGYNDAASRASCAASSACCSSLTR